MESVKKTEYLCTETLVEKDYGTVVHYLLYYIIDTQKEYIILGLISASVCS